MTAVEPTTSEPGYDSAPRAGGIAAAPEPMSRNPVRRVVGDLVTERRGGALPPGPGRGSVARARRMARDPLSVLLPLYEQYGPIFSTRLLHSRVVFMLGPEANHYVTVSHPQNFAWREGSFGDLIPLLGDGLLTIDGAYHDRARRIMMPAFHRERIEASISTMAAETEVALEPLVPGEIVDVYDWARNLAMRIAMRALRRPRSRRRRPGRPRRRTTSSARSASTGSTSTCACCAARARRGGSCWRRGRCSTRSSTPRSRERRRRPDPERQDILSLLIEARDEDGSTLTDTQIRDQLMTLIFAGHDTSTSTLSFMFYELARHPRALARLQAEQDEVLGGRPPTADRLFGGMPYLDMVLDETLRLYPPAWIGPRRAVREFEFAGHRVPDGAYVNYCSWASHRLPEVFPDPEAFVPERFERERKVALPRGAYIPFGGGSRICIGKRFGQTEVKLVAAMALSRLRFERLPGRTMTVRQMPTLSPDGGLEMRVRPRDPETA